MSQRVKCRVDVFFFFFSVQERNIIPREQWLFIFCPSQRIQGSHLLQCNTLALFKMHHFIFPIRWPHIINLEHVTVTWSLQFFPGSLQQSLEPGVPTVHMLKLSPQPHVPLIFGLLKTNSLDSLSSI